LGLPTICKQLQEVGRHAETPVALVERATSSEQRVFTGNLATIVGVVEREKPRAPTLIIVGNVVRLHDDLAWFGDN
jgi:uroporphyrin-III C-methyltransferase/precorrin-2 dehydrogenase/sirohydrochlorin ferrochelatase